MIVELPSVQLEEQTQASLTGSGSGTTDALEAGFGTAPVVV